MLDNLTFGIEAENIDACGFVTKQIEVTHMDKGKVAVNSDPLYLVSNAANLLEKAHNAVEPVRNERIVLNVGSCDETEIQISPAFIEDLAVDNVQCLLDVLSVDS